MSVTQSGYAGELMMQPLPGVWSPVALTPGAELVAFAQTTDSRVDRVLAEPACTRVVPASPILPGLRIAIKAETDGLTLDRTLSLATVEASHLDPVFAEYLWDKYEGEAMASLSAFGSILNFTERGGLDVRTRQTLLQGAYDLVGMHRDDADRAQRLALSMCRLLLMPEAAVLHENLIGTYLPNLLGIASSLPPQPASKVFQGHESERDALRAFLRRYGTDGDAAALLAWADRN
jgi:hypothetical protein